MFRFTVLNKVELRVDEQEVLSSGARKIYKCQFKFDSPSDWEGFDKTACFRAGKVKASQALDENNECIIPPNVLLNFDVPLIVGVLGTKEDGTIQPTVEMEIAPVLRGVSRSGTTAPPPADVYAQLIAIANEAKAMAQSIKDEVDAGTFGGLPSDWNQNDPTQKDYIKNRPFYEDNVKEILIFDQTVTLEEASSGFHETTATAAPILTNLEYKVTIAGRSYISVSKSAVMDGTSYPAIGNMRFSGGSDTGEPFLIFYEEGSGTHGSIRIITDSTISGEQSLRIAEYSSTVVKIPTRYLPDDVNEKGIQADWNQNDPAAADYVKNRTHWEESNAEVEIMPETVLTGTPPAPWIYDDEGWFAGGPVFSEALTVGDTVTVTCDGIDYPCTVAEVDGMAAFGNIGAMTGGTDTGEPFLIASVPDPAAAGGIYAMVVSVAGAISMTLSIKKGGAVVHKIDPKYLPETIKVHHLNHTGLGYIGFDVFRSAMADLMAGKALVYLHGLQVCYAESGGTNSAGYQTYGLRFTRYPLQSVLYACNDSSLGYFSFDDLFYGELAIPDTGADILGSDNIVIGTLSFFSDGAPMRIAWNNNAGSAAGTTSYFYPLPDFTDADNGKVLGVVDGKLAWVEPTTYPSAEEASF